MGTKLEDVSTVTLSLDCETSETAIASLAPIVGSSEDHFRESLLSVSYKSFRRRLRQNSDAAIEHLYDVVFVDRNLPEFSTCWFHATRVEPGTDFREGLLSMTDARRYQEAKYGPAKAGRAWREKFQNGGRSLGPHAQLVKDLAFEAGRNHFFEAPESLVDLGYDVATVQATTAPCVVKIRVNQDEDSRGYALRRALLFAYCSTNGGRIATECHEAWSGYGTSVPPCDILRVEFFTDAEVARRSKALKLI